jgi:hypothetical protein
MRAHTTSTDPSPSRTSAIAPISVPSMSVEVGARPPAFHTSQRLPANQRVVVANRLNDGGIPVAAAHKEPGRGVGQVRAER